MNKLYGNQIRKDNIEFHKCKSEHWMQTEFDESVLDYWKLPNGIFMAKFEKDDGLDGKNDVKNPLPSHLGSIRISNIKRIMKHFIRKINGFFNNNVFYTDTDSLYSEKKNWNVLDKIGLVASNLCQVKND